VVLFIHGGHVYIVGAPFLQRASTCCLYDTQTVLISIEYAWLFCIEHQMVGLIFVSVCLQKQILIAWQTSFAKGVFLSRFAYSFCQAY
jgi:hypothetical protein